MGLGSFFKKVRNTISKVVSGGAKLVGGVLKTTAAVALGKVTGPKVVGTTINGTPMVVTTATPVAAVAKTDSVSSFLGGIPKPVLYGGAALAALTFLKK